MREHPFVSLAVGSVLSLAAHGIAYGSLAYVPKQPVVRPASRVSFRVTEPKPSVPEPDSPEPPPAPPELEPTRPLPEKVPAPVNELPPARSPQPLDLTGVTLTNDSGSSAWSTVVGNGAALDGPIAAIHPARPASAPPPRPIGPAPQPTPRTEPELVALRDLSERPVPPSLGAVLRDHYPAEAKARGIGGSASVTAEIGPDGRVRNVTLTAETHPGFGEACRRTLLGSRWSPPRSREGRAVATGIRYTCRFVVER
jgi:TonB family protein